MAEIEGDGIAGEEPGMNADRVVRVGSTALLMGDT